MTDEPLVFGRRRTDQMITFPAGGQGRERRGADRDERPARVVNLCTGDFYVTNKSSEMIVTILGSCVAVCLYDPMLHIGGMNHFLLPENVDASTHKLSESTRYGAFAMEQLINGMLALGAVKNRLEVKVFGGANVIKNSSLIGSKNVTFIKAFLQKEGLRITSSDLGGDYPRRLRFYPDTGKAMLLKLQREEDKVVLEKERVFADSLQKKPMEGDIELFS
jgi:chemotaxis protein CheD